MLVPVVDNQGLPLEPCKPVKARLLIRGGKATPFRKNGFFAIRLNRIEVEPRTTDCVLGIDPGSKRTGYTVCSGERVVLNVQSNAPNWVKKKVEARRNYRRARRYRKTPYRKCRFNRSIGGLSPSTKSRWQAHLRVYRTLKSVLPINLVCIEDIKAKTKKGCRRWNKNFSPLEVGKKWFEGQIDVDLDKVEGYTTYMHRRFRGFKKCSNKKSERWEAHCVDSHCLCEIQLGLINPRKHIYILEHIRFNRRELHQGFKRGGTRRLYGSTKSQDLNRGALVVHPKYNLAHVGGTSKGKVSLHGFDGKRLCQNAAAKDLKVLTNASWRAHFLPQLKQGVSVRKL